MTLRWADSKSPLSLIDGQRKSAIVVAPLIAQTDKSGRGANPLFNILSLSLSLMDMATATATASATPLSFIVSTSSLPSKSPPTTLSPSSSSSPLKSATTFHQNHTNNYKPSTLTLIRRRDLLKTSGLAFFPPLFFNFKETPLSHAREVQVGSYLPPSPSDPSFVVFKASPKDTPALRAGNVEPYQFIIPPTWKQTRIANILSGNYCQPKCAEPWIEVKFEDEKQGKIQVVASPLIRLTNKPNATIEDIGSPEKVIASLGAFITGNTYDPDELLETSIEKRGDQTYYKYVLQTPFALTGSHNLAKVTAKGSTVVLFVASASDKQWPASQKTLQSMLDSFQL